MATAKLTDEDVDKLLHMVVQATERVDPEPEWADLLPAGYTGYSGEGDDGEAYFYRLRPHLFRIEPAAAEAAKVLARQIRNQSGAAKDADEADVFMEVLDAVCAVMAGDQKMRGLGKRLLTDLATRVSRSVNVLPVGGLVFAGGDEPVRLGDRVVLGPLTERAVEVIDEISRDQVSSGFALTGDAWWAEDLLAFRSDPAAYNNVRPETGISVVAVAVDAVGAVAAVRARELVEAMLGALWLVEKHRTDWTTGTPWIVGRPTMIETPRTPGCDEDGDLPLVVLQTNTRDHKIRSIDFGGPRSLVDVEATLAFAAKLFDLIAHAETPGQGQLLARRVAATSRLALLAGQDTATDVELLHLVVGLEALVSEHQEGAGVTDRFVRRVLALLPDRLRDVRKVEGLYRLRSEVGHQGFAVRSKFDVAKACIVAREMLVECVLAVAEIADKHRFRSDTDLIRWLDHAAPDLDNPFAH